MSIFRRSNAITPPLAKLCMHRRTKVIYTQYKFHIIPFITYQVMAEDRKVY